MAQSRSNQLDLPGFRFHPTEEELLDFYLRQMVHRKKLDFNVIGTINLYRYDPWELPGLAKIGEREWYFFVPRDRKKSSGGRPNRTTDRGFWKATGCDKGIRSAADPKRLIGLKKTLVFYLGRAPRGSKTDWIMNEYRLPDPSSSVPSSQEDIVLCKVYRKATSLKELEQRAAQEQDTSSASISEANASVSVSDLDCSFQISNSLDVVEDVNEVLVHKEEKEVEKETEMSSSSMMINARSVNLPEIDVPVSNAIDEWTQDPFLMPARSPWMEQCCWPRYEEEEEDFEVKNEIKRISG